jgi:hypothetical protein
MFRFFLRVLLLFRNLGRGLRADPDAGAIGFLLFLLLTIGTCFYHWVEGWGWVDAFYFCVMTVATVGFGDFSPTTTASKIFTVFFTFLGIGLFASFVGKVAVIWIYIHKKKGGID